MGAEYFTNRTIQLQLYLTASKLPGRKGKGRKIHRNRRENIYLNRVQWKPKEVLEVLFKLVYTEAVFLWSIARLTLTDPALKLPAFLFHVSVPVSAEGTLR